MPIATILRRGSTHMVALGKALLKNDLRVAFAIALTWQLVMTIVGSALMPSTAFLQHTTLWDGGWYLSVINEQYRINPASAAFYPLFPLIVGVLAVLTFHIFSLPLIGLVVNTVALGFAIAALLTIAKHFNMTVRARYACVVFFLLSPAAIFLHQFYGEAVFAAVGFWAYAYALKRRWLYVGILLAILTASRLPALLFVGLCLLEYLRAYDWNFKKALNRKALYFLLAPIGFVIYGFYLLAVRGDFFAMFSAYHATDDWAYQSFNPNFLYPIVHGYYETLLAITSHAAINSNLIVGTIIPLFSLTILFICSLYLVLKYRGKGIPLGIFGLVAGVFFTLNSNLVSVHRYTLPCLGIYIAMALVYRAYPKLRVLVIGTTILSAAIQLLLIIWLYTTDKFVG